MRFAGVGKPPADRSHPKLAHRGSYLAEETAIQTQVVFLLALEAEGLIGTVENRLDNL
jgi:hypothetical protein